MSTRAAALAEADDPERARHLRRAIVASTVGTTIEWYDYFLYSTVTPLVFAALYFPNSDPLTSQLNAFAVYFVGFVARPIGAAIFGHYGDRIGRKAALIASLLLMGLGTFLVALVPGYAAIGIAGGIILSVLRFVQGVGVGGEWGGSVLLAMEWGRHGRRGFNASWPQFGVPAGLLLANIMVLIFSLISGPEFVTWGWRIPFLLSIILVGLGLWIRLGILETPIFQQLLVQERVERQPVVQVIKRHPKEIILASLARLSEQAPFYIFTAFIFTYAVGAAPALGFDRNFILLPVLVASIL
ncbi:MAG: MFS transporter, partial [Chloroflexi bacterium]|nr:MFS transporter [Chloroflexota bacterium]